MVRTAQPLGQLAAYLLEQQSEDGLCVWGFFEDAVQEIFAVQVLAGRRFPDVINDHSDLLADSFVLPDAALAEVSAPLRDPPVRAAALAG